MTCGQEDALTGACGLAEIRKVMLTGKRGLRRGPRRWAGRGNGMTVADGFPQRLKVIDEVTRGDHWYLRRTDACRFLGEYTAGKGFSYSATNGLILDFKTPVSRTVRRNLQQ